MSEDDGGAYHRALYALNVSSSLNLAGEEMPEPVRTEGDVIRFNRCTPAHFMISAVDTNTLCGFLFCDVQLDFQYQLHRASAYKHPHQISVHP